MAHISTKVTAAPEPRMAEHPGSKHGAAGQMQKRQYKQCQQTEQRTSSQRIHSMAARIKLLTTTASAKPAPAKPAVRTCVPGANTFKSSPAMAAASAGTCQKLRRRTAQSAAKQQDQHVQQPGHLMPAADDKTAHTARCRMKKLRRVGSLSAKAELQTPARRSARPAKSTAGSSWHR